MIYDFRQLSQAPLTVAPGLRLRQFTLGDAYDLSQLHADSTMTRWLLDDVSLHSRDMALSFLHGLSKLYRDHPGLGIWAIEREDCRYTADQLAAEGAAEWLDEKAISKLLRPVWQLYGWFNLTPIPGQPDRVELGSRLHPALQGQQIACSTGQLLIDYAFNVLELPALNTHCHAENHAALFCSSYLGFAHPEAVPYQGGEALSLSLHPYQWAVIKDASSSHRRREAYHTSRRWADEFAGAVV